MSSTYVLGIIFAMIVLVSIFLRMRNSGMKEAYSTWWIIISIGCVVFALIPGGLRAVSSRLGVEVPLNLGFFVAGIILLLLSLRFSVDLSHNAEDRRRLAEEIAILRAEVDRLTARIDEAGIAAPAPGAGSTAPTSPADGEGPDSQAR